MAAQPAAAAAESVIVAEEVSVRVGAPAEAVSTSPLLDCATTGTCWEVATVFSVTVNLSLAGHHKRCAKRCRFPVNFAYGLYPDSYEIDGGFLFGQSEALWSIARYEAPMLLVIMNNHLYNETRARNIKLLEERGVFTPLD